jgi:acyl dehydratase
MDLPLVVPAIAAVPYYRGIQLGWTSWVEIDEARLSDFVAATGERNWLHTDAERAERESPWKELIVPGALLISLVPSLLPELLVLVGWSTAINAAVEDLRFPTPARVGRRVRMSATLGRGRNLPGGGCRLPIEVSFEADIETEPVCTGRVIYIYYP